jgi:hypothetical protein
MPNFNLLLTVTSDINGVLFPLFNPVFVPYIRFITVNKHQKSVFFSRYKLQIRQVLELNRLAKFVRVGFNQHPNLKICHSEFLQFIHTFKI